MKRAIFCVGALFVATIGCSHLKETISIDSVEATQAFQNAQLAEDRGDWDLALKDYSRARNLMQTAILRSRATLGAARVQIHKRDFDACKQDLGALAGTDAFREIRLEALYWIAICHEGSGDTQSAIAAWLDLDRLLVTRPNEQEKIWFVETPVRLSEAYARLGNLSESQRYLKLAEEREKNLKQSWVGKDSIKELWAELYLRKGSLALPEVTSANFYKELSVREVATANLLQAAYYGSAETCAKVETKLMEAYERFLDVVRGVPLEVSEDEVAAQKTRQLKMQDLAGVLYGHILSVEQFLRVNLPERPMAKLYEDLGKIKLELNQLLYERPVGQGLTPEAKKREGLFRNLKLIPLESARK